jgi:hypothetical protein
MATPSLRAALLQQGGTLAEAVSDHPSDHSFDHSGPAVGGSAPAQPAGAPQLAASGPRAEGRRGEYELLLEMILEGSLLHYGPGRVVQTRDHDLALLLGDQLYALGLSRLAALGDLDAVAELADLISLVATAHASGDGPLADQVWRAGAAAIGWGSSAAHESAKELARAGHAQAAEALQRAADEAISAEGERGK